MPLRSSAALRVAPLFLALALAIRTRRTLAFAAACSATLGLLAAVLWARSAGTCDQAVLQFETHGVNAGTIPGLVARSNRGGLLLASTTELLFVRGRLWRPGTKPLYLARLDVQGAGPLQPPFAEHPDFALLPYPLRLLGIGWTRTPSEDWVAQPELPGTVLVLQWWLVELMTWLLPILWLRSPSRRERAIAAREQGLCGHCGYDLRATPQSTAHTTLAHSPVWPICPECGTPSRQSAD